MKKGIRKIIALTVSMAMMFTAFSGVFASAANYPDMPDNWATAALQSAVDNELLFGNADGYLRPDANLTRAEMASIIVRAFAATVNEDISSYTDVNKNAWYYDALSKAVRMGAFYGDDANTMRPDSFITRQEAFLVLARVLVLSSNDYSSLDKYTDSKNVAAWAKEGLAALAQGGYINGNNGTLRPKDNISRAEFAQLMANLFKQYLRSAGTYSTVVPGNVVITTAMTLKNVTVSGDLIIGDGADSGKITLDNVKIEGRLLVRGGNIVPKNDPYTAKGVVVKNVNGTVHFSCYASDAFVKVINAITPVTFDSPNNTLPSGGGGGGSTKTALTQTPTVDPVVRPASDPANTDIAGLKTLLPSTATSDGQQVTISWATTATFAIKGKVYSFTGTVTPVDTGNYIYKGSKILTTVTIEPVIYTVDLPTIKYVKVGTSNTTHALLGLPNSTNVTFGGNTNLKAVAWSPASTTLNTSTVGNYADFTPLVADVPAYATLSVEKTKVQVTAKDTVAVTAVAPQTGLTYGDTLGNPSYTLGAFQTGVGQNVTVTYTYSGTTAAGIHYGPTTIKPTEAGSYTITVNYEDTLNVGSGSADFTILKKAITATVVAVSRSYGDANPTFTYTVLPGAVVGTDNIGLTLSSTATAASPVGTYSVTGTASNKNYTVTVDGANKLTVTARGITVTADAKIREYGNANPSFTYTLTAGTIYGSDNIGLVLATTATADSPVGSYNITGTASNTNYAVAVVGTGKLTITKRAVTITVNPASRGVGQPNPTFTYQVTAGTIYGSDDLGVTLTSAADLTSPAGTYDVTGSASNTNYNVTIIGTGKLTVVGKHPITVTVTAPQTGLTYGETLGSTGVVLGTPADGFGTTPTYTYSYTGTDSAGNSYGPSSTPPVNAGTYTVSVVYEDSKNYGTGNANFTIAKKAVTAIVNAVSRRERAANPTLTYWMAAGSVLPGDTLGLELATTAGIDSVAGSYDVTGTSVNKNYNVTVSGTGKLTVTKWTMMLSAGFKIRSGFGLSKDISYPFAYSPNTSMKAESLRFMDEKASLLKYDISEMLFVEHAIDSASFDIIKDETGELLPIKNNFEIAFDQFASISELTLSLNAYLSDHPSVLTDLGLPADTQFSVDFVTSVWNEIKADSGTVFTGDDAKKQLIVLYAVEKRIDDLVVSDVWNKVSPTFQKFLEFTPDNLAELKTTYKTDRLGPYIGMVEDYVANGSYTTVSVHTKMITVPAQVNIAMLFETKYQPKVDAMSSVINMTDAQSKAAFEQLVALIDTSALFSKVGDKYYLRYDGPGYDAGNMLEDNMADYYFNLMRSINIAFYDALQYCKPASGVTEDQMIEKIVANQLVVKAATMNTTFISLGGLVSMSYEGTNVDPAAYNMLNAFKNMAKLIRTDINAPVWKVTQTLGFDYMNVDYVYDSSKIPEGSILSTVLNIIGPKIPLVDGNWFKFTIDMDY